MLRQLVFEQLSLPGHSGGVLLLIMGGITLLTRDLNYLSKNLLKPLVELSDEVEPRPRKHSQTVRPSPNCSPL